MIAKAIYQKIINSHEPDYGLFFSFFLSVAMGQRLLQAVLMPNITDDWDKESPHYEIVEKLDSLYFDLYKKYENNEYINKADSEANDNVTKILSS